MKTEDFDIVGSYNNQRTSEIDSERSINVFEYIDPLGKKPKTLIYTSGLTNSNLIFSGAIMGFRAQFVFQTNQYVVIGSSIFLINSSNIVSLLGTLMTNSGYVGIDANTFQVIFVDGTHGYIWDTNANTFTQITDTSFPVHPIDVCYLDGFFVVANGGTNNFQLSMYNQGLVWGPAQDTFSASAATNLLTLSNTANYQTGVPVTLEGQTTFDSFTASTVNSELTLTDTSNYITGTAIKFSNSGTLPSPLVSGTTYFAINIDTTHIRVASTYSNSISNIFITLTTNGTPPTSVMPLLPLPLNDSTTYYTIYVSTTTIKLAATYNDAITNNPIILQSNGANDQITSQGQLQLASITTHPGNIVACRTLHRKLFLFSSFYTEVWENQGTGTTLPFRRNNSLLMEYGTAAIGSISVGFDKMFFLSQSRDGLGSVMEVEGTQASAVSNRALDFQFSQYAALNAVSDCRAFLIKENGLIFYRMNFTEANHTFVYNETMSDASNEQTKLWHEEEVLNGDRHPAQTHAYFNGINYVGDYKSPILYIVDSGNSTNAGQPIRRARITRPMTVPGYQRRRVDRLQIDLLQGNVSVSDEMPFVYLSISKDGGQSYGNVIKSPMGLIGQRTYRTVWRKLGVIPRGQSFVAKFEFYNQFPFIVLGGSWAYEVLPE